MKVCKKCGKEFPNRIRLSDGSLKFLSRRKYCLECSPLGLHNTRPIEDKDPNLRQCSICKGLFPKGNFPTRNKEGGGKRPLSYCQECFGKYQNQRWCKIKIKAIGYKGGECTECGAKDLHPTCYDFHHEDPDQKEYHWGQLRNRSWSFLVEELDKCVLVCSNCHRVLHAAQANWEDSKILPLWSKGYDPTLLRS